MNGTDALSTELLSVVRRLKQRLVAAAKTDDVTPSQRSILGALLEKPSWTQTELAKREHVRPQSIGAIVASLEGLGLVTKAPHPDDGRCVVVKITAAGRRLLRGARQNCNTWLAEGLANSLDASERKQLARALPLLEKLIDPA